MPNPTKQKSTLNKVKTSIVKYWYLFLAGVVALLIVFSLKRGPFDSLYGNLMAKYRRAFEESKKDTEEISNIREQELLKQDELNRRYAETLKTLQNNQKLEVQNISKNQENTIKEILSETNGSPEEMTVKVSQYLGIPIAPKNEEVQ
jgi:cell shape-determining protein MreC